MRLLIFLALACSLIASDQLSTARLGYTLAADGSLLTVDGVSGAAHLSSTTDRLSYLGLQSASQARLALAWSADTLTICDATCRQRPLPQPPLAVALSPSGAYFSLLSETSLITYTVSTLRSRSVALAPLGLVAGGRQSELAVSDDGTTLMTMPDLVLISPPQGHPTVAPGSLSFPHFFPHSPLAVAYSPAQHAILVLNPATLSAEEVLRSPDGLTHPTALEVTESALWVSQSGATPLLSYALATRATAAYSLTAGSLRPLGTPGVYLWSDSALLDATRSTPQVLVIASEAH